jgi:hypothetical protein
VKNRKLKSKLVIVSIIAIVSISFGVMPAAMANGVDLSGNYKCSDGTPAPDGYDPFQTYYVVGYEVATGSGEACTGPVVIFSGVTSIGESAFENATGITSLTISNSVTTIGESAFEGVTAITSLTIPNSVTLIGIKAFKNAVGLTSLNLGNSVTTIKADAFHNVYGLSTLNIPNSVQIIEQQAFRNLGITDLYIPDSVTTIGDYAFYSSVNLSRVQIGSGVTTYGVGIFDLTSLSETQSAAPYPQTVFYCGTFNGVLSADFDSKGSGSSCADPGSPDLNQVDVLGENSVRLTFTAPTFTGAGTVTKYEVSIRDPSGENVLSTQSFTPSPVIARGGTSTLTVVNLTAGTTYRFSLKSIKLVDSIERGSYQSYSLSATTTASSGGGGTGGGGTTTSTTAADELRRQQEAAAAAKQKQDQELREILSLVPTIAGLAQGIAGLGNSLLLPQKCVKGKTVKKVKAGAKCPKGYKVRK